MAVVDVVKPPHGLAELEARYGRLLLGPDPRGGQRIISPIGWESKWMTVARGLPGLPEDRRVYMHRDMEQPLRNALAVALSLCPGYRIKTLGCFNPRHKRVNGRQLSLHAYGLAVDINAASNPMRSPIETDIPSAFVRAFDAEGFVWGGDFGLPDPMHFQLASGY